MRKVFLFLTVIIFISCSSNRYAATNKDYKRQAKELAKEIKRYPLKGTMKDWVGTTNFNLRKPNIVVIHHTAQNSCEQTLQTFTLPRTQVSAHYVICKDGTVHHMLNDYLRAWHAGLGSWGNIRDVNSSSIGIELDNNGFEPFPDAQINSLLVLLDTLKTKYSVPQANFIGHADLAPKRKNDPNVNFPWELLAEKGFGIWHGDTSAIEVPADFNPIMALRIIGYSVEDPADAIRAFGRHFLKQDDYTEFTEGDLKILYDLMKKSE
ncbi:MAG: N-acetylmuramoyl-L-alanine amidase [Chitinophagaceae bacterium]|nr:N-acetylmuramoyl-L-alanine amidase [Chitinophagaceae bacterium]